MDRIGLISGYDETRVKKTLDLLLRDRRNEFRELAEAIGIPRTTGDWEVIILKFCLDFESCFKIWTDSEEPNSIKNAKCMTIMREMAKEKKRFTEIINLQNIANTLYTEFHQTYKTITS
jgi:DNA-binding Lrp family transcriptional regulator